MNDAFCVILTPKKDTTCSFISIFDDAFDPIWIMAIVSKVNLAVGHDDHNDV